MSGLGREDRRASARWYIPAPPDRGLGNFQPALTLRQAGPYFAYHDSLWDNPRAVANVNAELMEGRCQTARNSSAGLLPQAHRRMCFWNKPQMERLKDAPRLGDPKFAF